jgi:hypothetical protein
MRSVGRSIAIGGLFVLLAGFSPGSSCAKACRQGGKSADDIARHGDDLAHVRPRVDPHLTPAPGTRGMIVPGAGIGGVGDDLGHLAPSSLDDAVAALPEPDGGIAKLATRPTADGTRIRIEKSGRSFGRDYGRSVDDLAIEPAQHAELLDAFEIAQAVAEEVIGQLAEAAIDDDPTAAEATREARRRLRDAASALDLRMQGILEPAQYRDVVEALGSAEVIAYRLGRETPIHTK